jgi:hypothetical protein
VRWPQRRQKVTENSNDFRISSLCSCGTERRRSAEPRRRRPASAPRPRYPPDAFTGGLSANRHGKEPPASRVPVCRGDGRSPAPPGPGGLLAADQRNRRMDATPGTAIASGGRPGFTTKPDGHGFGLHSCALAASRMGDSLRAESEELAAAPLSFSNSRSGPAKRLRRRV